MRKHFISGAIAILALGTIAIPGSADAHGSHSRRVRLLDNCDPATFNAKFGPGVCIPHGNGRTTTLNEFLEELNPVDFGHHKWLNKPDELDLNVGDSISVVVRGGEAHTFTEVDEFGAGCFPDLNIPLGLTGPAPSPDECFGPGGIFATSLVPANGQGTLLVEAKDLPEGTTHLFMCEIHPWMRTVVTVEADD